MTAFDTALEQKSDPVMRVLDALFVQIQQEQKFLQRRYMAVTELRGLAGRLMRDGSAVSLQVAGDDMVMRVTVPGLSGFASVVPVEAAAPLARGFDLGGEVAIEVSHVVTQDQALRAVRVPTIGYELSESDRAQLDAFNVSAGGFVSPNHAWLAVAGVEAPQEPVGDLSEGIDAVPAVTPVDDLDALIAAQEAADVPAASAAPVDAVQAQEAIEAAARSAQRGGRWPGVWSDEDHAQLVKLTADNMRNGMGKMAAAHAAGKAMGRTAKAGESRIFNVLKAELQIELARPLVEQSGDDLAPAVKAALRPRPDTVKGGEVMPGWTLAERTRLVEIVADALCAGKTKGIGVEIAAAALGRTRAAAYYRLHHQEKSALAAEMQRRAAGRTTSPAPAPAVVSQPADLPAAPPPERVTAGHGGGVAPSAPAKPLSAPAAAPVVAALAPAPVAPPVAPPVAEPVRRAPAPAILDTARPPHPPEGQRVTAVAAPDDPGDVLAHVRALTKGNAQTLKQDFAIIHLACAGWKVGDIATDLGLDSKFVKLRFEALCGYQGGKGRFLRSHVYEAIEAMLTPKAVA